MREREECVGKGLFMRAIKTSDISCKKKII